MRLVHSLATLAILLGSSSVLRAAESLDFVLPDNDGYGVADCMKPGMACGQVIADSWCEAHGHAHATAFGISDDVTGTVKISTSAAPPVPPGSILIHCGE